ncbi:MAG: TlpA family protein disulfide reductase [Bradyrhizobium sp.]
MRLNLLSAVAAGAALAAGVGLYAALQQPESVPADLPIIRASKPTPLPEVRFQDGAGSGLSLTDFQGKFIVLNVWATWCAPCREEMPALDRLQQALGGPGFEVVALSIDQQGSQVVRRFFNEVGVKTLKVYVDPSVRAGFKLATVGLPTTLIVDRQGREIGRHVGPAKWDAPEMVEGLRSMLGAPAP